MTERFRGCWFRVILLVEIVCGFAAAGNVAAQGNLESTLDLAEKFRPGISLMWSPCGQAAWDELRAYHHVPKIVMTPRSATAELLNDFQWDAKRTLPSGTLIFGGDDSEAFRKHVREEVRKLCGNDAASIIGSFRPPGPVTRDGNVWRIKSGLVVSAFARSLKFTGSFTDDGKVRDFFDAAGKVHRSVGFGTFGAQSGTYGESVLVLEDDLKGDFCLKFRLESAAKDGEEFLLLQRDAALANFQEGITKARKLMAQERRPKRTVEINGQKLIYTDQLEENDILWMPQLHAALSCDFADLEHKRYLEGPSERTWCEISEAQQFLNFRLNHQGALIQAVFKVNPDFLTSAGGDKVERPVALARYQKVFRYDKPFMATFWRVGADYPYLACWVAGPDVLMEKPQ